MDTSSHAKTCSAVKQHVNGSARPRGRGWHASGVCPHAGKGAATVQPLREKKHINAIKAVLAGRPRDYALFMIGVHFGLRANELLALRWRDLLQGDDLNAPVRDYVEIAESKTARMRPRIAVSTNARKAIERFRDSAGNWVPDHFVFTNIYGKPLTVQRLHQLINDWCRLANVSGHFGTHTLRKTFGYHHRKAGHDIALLMRIFGHSNQAVTLRYIGLEQDEIDAANLKLNL